MAETIALVASIIAVIQMTDRVAGLCKSYIQGILDAPSDLHKIHFELTMLKTIFKYLHLLNTSGTVPGLLQDLGAKDGPIRGCEISMAQLEGLFPSDGASVSGQKQAKKRKLNVEKAKKTWATLAWPFKQSKAKMLLEDISRYKTTISLALTADAIHDAKTIKIKTSQVYETLTAVQRHDVYRWLQSTDPSPIHQRSRKCYEPGTGNWMLQSVDWNDWLNATKRCLWIHGIPGAGKTVLMSELIEKIKIHCSTVVRKDLAYAYYYCYFGHNQKEAVPFLRWLLTQLCRHADMVPPEVYQLYKQGCEPSLEDLFVALEQVLCQYKTVYVAVDAIDESQPQQDLLSVLQSLATDARFEKVQLVASSREYTVIENVMETISVPISMNNPSVQMDIRRHVKSLIHGNQYLKHWPPDILREVEDAVSTGARGMFRWAVCQVDALQYLKCDRQIVRQALLHLPETLEETYDRIFKRVSAPDRTFVLHVLHWISFHDDIHNCGTAQAAWGIPSSILLQAAIVSTSTASPASCNRFYNLKRLRELCGCLIRMDSEEVRIKGEATYPVFTMGFAHYTVREYFESTSAFMANLADGRTMRRELLQVALSSAQNIESQHLAITATAPPTSSEVVQALTESLGIYTVLSAVLAIYHWQDALSEWDSLQNLAIALLNPTRPHFSILKIILSRIEAPTDYLLNRAANCYDLWKASISQFLTVSAQTQSETEAMVIASALTVLLLTNKAKTVLAKKILQKIAPRDLCQMNLILKKDMMLGDPGYMKPSQFQGSVVELFVQMALMCQGPLGLLLRPSLDFCDPTRILLLYMEAHSYLHQDDLEPTLCDGDSPNSQTSFTGGKCLLSDLLQAGADPCASGY